MTVRWGIAGPGAIAERFAQGLAQLDDAELAAVGSRDLGRAQAFGARHGGRAVGSSAGLAEDRSVDAVYVATPASSHMNDTLMFFDAGKHVLCEKPFALDAGQAARMVETARRRGAFLMEAMWSGFLPAYRILREPSRTIDLPAFMHRPDHLVVQRGADRKRIDAPWEGEGLRFQVEEVHRCRQAGRLESDVMPLDESISVMRTLDAIRAEIGLRFPGA